MKNQMKRSSNRSDNTKPLVHNRGTKKISRGEAIQKMGAMAASVPFIYQTVSDMNPSDLTNGQYGSFVPEDPVLKRAVDELEYLTPSDKFIVQRRGNPVLSEIPDEKLSAIGLTRETWNMEVVTDEASNSELGNPLTRENGNAFNWNDLMKLAETKAVRYLHVLSCTNARKLYGMGLWEGVPLRDVLWKAGPRQNIRRIYYFGYHNNDPSQIFKSSLHISRVLEEAPGELPVILCYKLNGKYISHANGGPVRLFVPGLYGNRSIKWLQGIVVTNSYHANDTYAEGNNDVESPIKTCAKFIKVPEKVKTGDSFAFTGLAQVGISGLKKVQYWLRPVKETLKEDDIFLANGDWKDAIMLPPPSKWGSDLPDGKLPPVLQADPETGRLLSWPLTYTIVQWAALEKTTARGDYEVRCRTIDENGIAQPMPRPFGRSGVNNIEVAKLVSE